MFFFLSTTDYELDESHLQSSSVQAEISKITVDFITSMRATVVSLGMYPPGSKTIENAVEKVSSHLNRILALQKSCTFSEVNGLLLIDGKQLDERDRKKEPVVDFIASMIERNIQSLTFNSGTTSKELVQYLFLMSKKPKDLQSAGPLPQQMSDAGIEHIQLNERIYVATTHEEQEEAKAREELLAKMMQGELSAEDLSSGDLFSDKEQIRKLLRQYIEGSSDEAGPGGGGDESTTREKASRLADMIERSAQMLNSIENPEHRQTFKDGLVQSLVETDPAVLAKFFMYGEQGIKKLEEMGIEEQIFLKMSHQNFMQYTEYVIGEVEDLKRRLDTIPPEDRAEEVNRVKTLVSNLLKYAKERDDFLMVVERLKLAGVIKGKVAEQMEEQARKNAEAAGVVTVSSVLTNPDGSINEDALNKAVNNFDKISDSSVAEVARSLEELVGEVVFNPAISSFVRSLVARLDAEMDFNEQYMSMAALLEKLSRELIFNERYADAEVGIDLFRRHSDAASDRNPNQRGRSAQALASISSEEVQRILLAVFQHGEEAIQEQVSNVWIAMGEKSLPYLLTILKESDDRRLRRSVLALFKRMGKAILPELKREMGVSSNQWFVVRNLVLLLGELGGPEHFDDIVPMTAHQDPRVRKEAAKALANLNPALAEPIIRPMLLDRDIGLRRFAINLIGSMKSLDALPQLTAFLEKRTIAQNEEDELLQVEAVIALGKLGDPSCVPVLIETLKKEGMLSRKRTKPASVRSNVCWVLAQFPNDATKKALREAAKDATPEVRDAARGALMKLGE